VIAAVEPTAKIWPDKVILVAALFIKVVTAVERITPGTLEFVAVNAPVVPVTSVRQKILHAFAPFAKTNVQSVNVIADDESMFNVNSDSVLIINDARWFNYLV
jgi:hypothetical protein